MPITVAKTSFAAGVVAPEYRGRTEAPFYAEGVAVADNWQVLPSGAARVRPGTRVVAPVDADSRPLLALQEIPLRMFTYRDLIEFENDILLIFGRTLIAAVRQGATLRAGIISEPDDENTAIREHGYDDVRSIRVSQNGTQMIFTSNDREPMVFEPRGTTLREFTFRPYRFGDPRDDAPVSELISVRTQRFEDPGRPAGEISERADIALRNAGALYLVTVVDRNGREYNYARPKSTTGSYNYSSIRAAAHIEWEAHPRADFYRLYRSSVNPQVTELYTPGSAAANAEAARLEQVTKQFGFEALGDTALNYSSGTPSSRYLRMTGSLTDDVARLAAGQLDIVIRQKSTVSILARWPLEIKSIADPDSSTTETNLKNEVFVILTHKRGNVETELRQVQKFTSDSDIENPFRQQIEINAQDIPCEAGDTFQFQVGFQSSTARNCTINIPAPSTGTFSQIMVYSRDRETTPVQPTRAAFVPVSAGLGLLAETRDVQFDDYNYSPDFSRNPPTHDNPFAEARITDVDTVSGTNLNINLAEIVRPSELRKGVTPIVGRDGRLTGAYVKDRVIDASSLIEQERVNGYKNYQVNNTTGGNAASLEELQETEVRTGGGGTIRLNFSLAPDYPQCSAVFQQRRIFAGGAINGSRIWGSRVGDHTDFSLEQVPTDSGPWQFDIDVSTEASISHMVPVALGLLIFTAKDVWLLSSGQEGAALTATQNSLTRQSSFGCAEDIEPLLIGNEVYYVDASRTSIIRLQYSREARQYAGVRTTRLVEHILHDDNKAVSWAYARAPDSRLYVTLQDGTLLDAYVNEDSGVMSFSTRNAEEPTIDWRLVETVPSRSRDEVYFAVRRSWREVHGESAPTKIEPDYSYAPVSESEERDPPDAVVSVKIDSVVTLETFFHPSIKVPYVTSWARVSIDIANEDIRSITLAPPRGGHLTAGQHSYHWNFRTRGVSAGTPLTGIIDRLHPWNGTWRVLIDGVAADAVGRFSVNIQSVNAAFENAQQVTHVNQITSDGTTGDSVSLEVHSTVDDISISPPNVDGVADNHFLVQETPGVHLDMQYPVAGMSSGNTRLHALEGVNATLLVPGTNNLIGNIGVNNIGMANWDKELSSAVIGVPYRAVMRTLKPVFAPRDSVGGVDIGLDAYRKLILDVWLDVLRTKGIKVGRTLQSSVELAERLVGRDDYGEVPIADTTGQFFLTPTEWSNEAQLYIIQDYPLGGTLLSVSYNFDLTDPRDEGAAAIPVAGALS